jgi:hypothetical protein
VNHFAGWHVEIENQQRHGYGKDAIAQGRKPLQALSGNFVVRLRHGVVGHSVTAEGCPLAPGGRRLQ